MTKKQAQARPCDYPGCPSKMSKRFAIETSWFRGDDIILVCCAEHRKPAYQKTLLGTDKAKRQA